MLVGRAVGSALLRAVRRQAAAMFWWCMLRAAHARACLQCLPAEEPCQCLALALGGGAEQVRADGACGSGCSLAGMLHVHLEDAELSGAFTASLKCDDTPPSSCDLRVPPWPINPTLCVMRLV